MAARSLAPLAGASLLALALPAAAQDHSHHPAPPVQSPAPTPAPAPMPQADPHAGHDMSTMADGEDHAMTSPLGSWPMSRDASGTSWQPDLSEHGGIHVMRGDWCFMGHALLNLT